MPRLYGVDIRIVERDGLSFVTDVFVLKHAQALYGLDAQVVESANIDPSLLPRPDEVRVIRRPKAVGAKALLFVGVPPIREFSYPNIRHFGYRALASVASNFPHAEDIAMTLHGVGYGLDESECFDAEVGGILEALESLDFPQPLRSISVIEVNRGRAARMTKRLDALTRVYSGTMTTGTVPSAKTQALNEDQLRTAGTDLGDRGHALVAMPFDPAFSDTFHYGIASAVRSNGLLCERIDRQSFVGDIIQRLRDQIATATIMVADLSGANPNVSLEVGFAWGHEVPTVLICKDGEKLKFDVQSQRCLFYSSIKDLEDKLQSEIHGLLPAL